MTRLEVEHFQPIAEGVYLEGLAVDEARGVIWYSDVIAGGIHGARRDGSSAGSFNDDRMWTGGIMVNSDGAILSTGQGGIMWNNPDTGRSGWLLDELDGKPINGINEMWPDGTGGIYFGTNDIEYVIEAKETRPTSLYRLTRDRQVIKLADNLRFSNGLAYDPQRQRLYCSDTFNTAWVWDVKDDLTLTNQRVLLDKDDCDGLSLDTEGNVLITGVFSPGEICRVTPDGDLLRPLAIPDGSATQIRFGGADSRDVFINVVPTDAGANLRDGKPLSGTSKLYMGRANRAGVVAAPADFKLS